METKIKPLKPWSPAPYIVIRNEDERDLVKINESVSKSFENIIENISLEIDICRLPMPTTTLVGRKIELTQLTESLTNSNKHLAIIVAAGGIGKSALTDEWLQQIAQENYYGKTRVFGWSFYSQGSHNTFTNSQPFFSAVLPFFGISNIPKDEIEKARTLAKCLQEQPTLLILDGLEPLQYAPNLAAMNGELQDSALKEFIACFRRSAGKSFVLLSSRQPLVELKKWQSEHYLSLILETLPHEDGEHLLQTLGVKGNSAERRAISQDLNGHALSLVLIGHLLSEYHDGDPRYAKELPPLTEAHGDSDAEKDSRHALRVLDYYDSLQDEASRRFLQLLGLFDRPVNVEEKAVLIANANYAEPLRALTDSEWNKLELKLEKSGLLLGEKGRFEHLVWDTHPIIRAYFGEKFKENHHEEFKQAHLVLFNYYQNLPEKEFPDTLEEMQPLYRAVIHGCLAQEYSKANINVYWKRICRTTEFYSTRILGAYSQNLISLKAFFPNDWNKPVNTDLSTQAQAWLLSETSFCLTSLGRFPEAIETRLAALNLFKKLKDWKGIAIAARCIVDLYLPIGQIQTADTAIEEALYAIHEVNKDSKNNSISGAILSNCYRGTIYKCYGDIQKALKYFRQAEVLQMKKGNYLSSFVGYLYCALLLESEKDKKSILDIRARAENLFALQDRNVHDDSYLYLIIARIITLLNINEDAEKYFSLAIECIQKSNRVNQITRFYLYRADFYLIQSKLSSALADLNSAYEIIERCGMKLYAVDYLLIHGRYCLATNDFDSALIHYEEAKILIQETGYHLRDAELDLFAARIRQQCDEQLLKQANIGLHSQTSEYFLHKAKNRIEAIGQHGLWRVIERDFPEFAKACRN